jgi:hypothetical protein
VGWGARRGQEVGKGAGRHTQDQRAQPAYALQVWGLGMKGQGWAVGKEGRKGGGTGLGQGPGRSGRQQGAGWRKGVGGQATQARADRAKQQTMLLCSACLQKPLRLMVIDPAEVMQDSLHQMC